MAKKKGLDLGLIQERVSSKSNDIGENESVYKKPPNYVARRMDMQSNMANGKREKRLTYRIDPSTCMIRDDHDRDYSNLNEVNCRELIDGIKMHGQETPAIVRQLEGVDGFQYELVCGARRHWVTSYLKSSFIVEVRDLSEEEVFIISDEENRNRKDISDYERAVKYNRALGTLYDSQVQMSERMGVSQDWLSRYLNLARVDKDIVKAFSDLSELKVRHARELRSLMKDNDQSKAIIEAAREMHSNPQKGAVVMSILKSKVNIKKKKSKVVVKRYSTSLKKKFMLAKATSSKKLVLEIDRTTEATLDDWLAAVAAAYNDYDQSKKTSTIVNSKEQQH